MFMIVVSGLYAIIYAAPHIEGFGIKTNIVQYDELPIADEVTALFVRNETLYTASYAGTPNYMIEAGTKIRKGTQVVYIESGNNPRTPTNAVLASFEQGSEEEQSQSKNPIDAIKSVAGSDAVVSEGGVSPTTAIVSYYGDGWEKKVTPENMLTLPKSIFDEAPNEAVDLEREFVGVGEPVYRITDNNLWYIAFWIKDADKTIMDKYKIGRRLTLDLETTKVRCEVHAAEPRGRDAYIILKSDMYYKDLDKYRVKDVSVVFSEVSGAVIEKQDVKLKSGKAGVYVKQQSGTYRWTPVLILKESGDFYLVAETSFQGEDGKRIQTVRYYDEIMSNPAGQGF